MSDSPLSSLPWLSLTAGVVGIAAAAWQERGAGSRAQNPYYVAPVDSGFSAGTHNHLSKTLGRDGRLYELRQERFRDQRSSRGGEGHPHDVVGVGTLDQLAGYEEHLYGAVAAVVDYRASCALSPWRGSAAQKGSRSFDSGDSGGDPSDRAERDRFQRKEAKKGKHMNRTCPKCKRPNVLSAYEAARRYQCTDCTRADEGGMGDY